MIQCPRCGLQVMSLEDVSPEIQDALNASGDGPIPPQVCAGCNSELRNFVSTNRQGVLMSQSKNRERRRLEMWKTRMGHIKKARKYMDEKKYSDAALAFEKYLSILEVIFEKKDGENLKPEDFKAFAKTSEMTILASVYWDLIRVYDTNNKYSENQKKASEQLALFLHFTPIYADIIRKAKIFQNKAKNPDIIKYLLKNAIQDKERCFIATSAFESADAPEVIKLRIIRDEKISIAPGGKFLIKTYYRLSPKIATFLDYHDSLKPAIRGLLRAMIKCVS